ncbi:reticulocyte-binding protein 2 homolog a-like [Papaver somniferum]|uniref:reticulocyte-binding protein 2 homolog a-like n=1 Tax=Papaver somniferum TaxID=3469 RepID=UPI000E700269|nr:reticulocyte-binding protein 2 homolog a-like [Papaver somniferum]
MEVIEENSQEDENLEDQRERTCVIDLATNRYEHPRELLRRANTNCEREEGDPRKGQMILHGREMLRDEYEREREIACARGNEERLDRVQIEANTERRRRRREETEQQEIQEAIRQNNHENKLKQARLKRPMREDLDKSLSEEILKEMA